jgi:small subunit ribosomal protein S7
LPDPVYGSRDLQKFINCIMREGKKSVAERVVYGSFDMMAERTGRQPLELFEEALDNVKPIVEIRPRRVGAQTYQVPVEVRPERRLALAFRWVIESARKQRGEKSMAARLAGELLDAARNEGNAIRRKQEIHRMAEANKAFSHYRW